MRTENSIENKRQNQTEVDNVKDLERDAADHIGREFHGSFSSKTLEKMQGVPSELKSHEEIAKAYANTPDKFTPEGAVGLHRNESKPDTQLQRDVDALVRQEMSIRGQREVDSILKETEADLKSGKSNRLEMTEEATSRELQKNLDARNKDERLEQ